MIQRYKLENYPPILTLFKVFGLVDDVLVINHKLNFSNVTKKSPVMTAEA